VDYAKLLIELQDRIGYRFNSLTLLEKALTHKSFANEQLRDPSACNERQEFLGDAVLDLVMAELLYLHYPNLPEGELSRIRAEMVSATALAVVGRRLDLGACLRLGRGELRSGGRTKDNLLADALEAVFGAIFLDAGWETTRKVLVPLFKTRVVKVVGRKSQDYKTRLQEIAQALHGQVPDYDLVNVSGPDHQRQYTIIVRCAGTVLGEGSGSSKKIAQQNAAREALSKCEPED
jgi:ribonuclease-3